REEGRRAAGLSSFHPSSLIPHPFEEEGASVADVIWGRIWGTARVLFDRTRRFGWIDLLLFVGLVCTFIGLVNLVREWAAPPGGAGPEGKTITIELSPWYLPLYTFYSLTRGILAYILSLAFTLTYGYWAAKDRVADRVLVPLLDILQSLPVLAFMPG